MAMSKTPVYERLPAAFKTVFSGSVPERLNVNLYVVILEATTPARSGGTDWFVNLRVIDPLCTAEEDLGPVELRVFAPHPNLLPCINPPSLPHSLSNEGNADLEDILRLNNAKLSVWNQKPSIVLRVDFKKRNEWLVFHQHPPTYEMAHTPRSCSCTRYHIHEEDIKEQDAIRAACASLQTRMKPAMFGGPTPMNHIHQGASYHNSMHHIPHGSVMNNNLQQAGPWPVIHPLTPASSLGNMMIPHYGPQPVSNSGNGNVSIDATHARHFEPHSAAAAHVPPQFQGQQRPTTLIPVTSIQQRDSTSSAENHASVPSAKPHQAQERANPPASAPVTEHPVSAEDSAFKGTADGDGGVAMDVDVPAQQLVIAKPRTRLVRLCDLPSLFSQGNNDTLVDVCAQSHVKQVVSDIRKNLTRQVIACDTRLSASHGVALLFLWDGTDMISVSRLNTSPPVPHNDATLPDRPRLRHALPLAAVGCKKAGVQGEGYTSVIEPMPHLGSALPVVIPWRAPADISCYPQVGSSWVKLRKLSPYCCQGQIQAVWLPCTSCIGQEPEKVASAACARLAGGSHPCDLAPKETAHHITEVSFNRKDLPLVTLRQILSSQVPGCHRVLARITAHHPVDVTHAIVSKSALPLLPDCDCIQDHTVMLKVLIEDATAELDAVLIGAHGLRFFESKVNWKADAVTWQSNLVKAIQCLESGADHTNTANISTAQGCWGQFCLRSMTWDVLNEGQTIFRVIDTNLK